MIPMRDGVKLHAVILKPADIAMPLPFLIQRTPYGVDGTSRASFFAQRPELARDGYIYVCEDIRGRYKSEGKFVMSRPLADHHDPKAVDESTDTYDTVAWLLEECTRQQRARWIYGHQLSRVSGDDGGHRSASGGEGDFAAGADDRCVDGRRFLSQRRLSPELRVRLRLWRWSRARKIRTSSYGKDKDGKPMDGFDYFLKRGNFAEDVKKSGRRCCRRGSSSSSIRHMTRYWSFAGSGALAEGGDGADASAWAATTTRKTCGVRRLSTRRWSRTMRITRTFWCWGRGGMGPGLRHCGISATLSTASRSARSFGRRLRRSSLRII